jgi:hypothetical protein
VLWAARHLTGVVSTVSRMVKKIRRGVFCSSRCVSGRGAVAGFSVGSTFFIHMVKSMRCGG